MGCARRLVYHPHAQRAKSASWPNLSEPALPQVTIAGLTKRFGDALAVDRMDLDVEDGSLTTFLGPSGCGKTTTLRMVAGLEVPSAGTIAIGDEVMYGEGVFVPPEKRQIGMVFQSYAIWPHMSVFENVAYPLKVRRLPRGEVRERTLAALDLVQLGDFAGRYPAQLSGGQQQRVAVARAIVFEPRILLFDEPLSNLDAKLREQMRFELRELQQRLGVTTLYVTHDQQEALAISDRVAVMEEGRIVQAGDPQDIYEAPINRFVADFVGWTNFLPATVEGGRVLVDGAPLACELPDDVDAGAGIEIAIRPVDIRVTRADAGDGGGADNTIEGDARATIYMGKFLICDVALAGHVVQGYAELNAEVSAGTRVRLDFDADAVRVLGR